GMHLFCVSCLSRCRLYVVGSRHAYLIAFRFFFFNHTPTTEIYPLSLHDALPISSTTTPWSACVPRPPMATSTCTGSRSRCATATDRKSTRLNSSHVKISYAVFCLKKKKKKKQRISRIKETLNIEFLDEIAATQTS